MKRNRGLLIGLLLLLVVLAGIFLIQGLNKFGDDPNKYVIEDELYNKIDVLSDNASVEIIPTTGSSTVVEFIDKKRKNKKYKLEAGVKKDTLTVKLKKKRWNFISFDFSFSNKELLVKVPEKQYNIIKVNTDNGRIKTENMNAEAISFETDNGRIELKNVGADSIKVRSSNGKILLEQVEGKIIGKTDNGRITLVTDNLDNPIDLTTANGRIDITTKNEPTNGTIDVKTDNGRIDVFGIKNERTVFGKGEHLIKLRTDNGRITVAK